jgi:hypothetical protein
VKLQTDNFICPCRGCRYLRGYFGPFFYGSHVELRNWFKILADHLFIIIFIFYMLARVRRAFKAVQMSYSFFKEFIG